MRVTSHSDSAIGSSVCILHSNVGFQNAWNQKTFWVITRRHQSTKSPETRAELCPTKCLFILRLSFCLQSHATIERLSIQGGYQIFMCYLYSKHEKHWKQNEQTQIDMISMVRTKSTNEGEKIPRILFTFQSKDQSHNWFCNRKCSVQKMWKEKIGEFRLLNLLLNDSVAI